MYLLYIDHSGEPAEVNEKYFVMAGVAVFERQIYFLEQELNQLQQECLPGHATTVEFHVKAIRSHAEPPWEAMPRSERDKLILRIYSAISRAHDPGLRLFGQVIEKSEVVADFGSRMAEALAKKKDAKNKLGDTQVRGETRAELKRALAAAKQECFEYTSQIVARGFEGLCTQFEYFLRRFYDATRPDSQQRGLMVFDHASYERDLELLFHVFRSHGTAVSQLYNIVGPPFVTDSRSTRMLQIADFVSYALFRRYESGDTSYLDMIADRFDELGGTVHGLAHVTSAFSTCMCFACLSRRLPRRAP